MHRVTNIGKGVSILLIKASLIKGMIKLFSQAYGATCYHCEIMSHPPDR